MVDRKQLAEKIAFYLGPTETYYQWKPSMDEMQEILQMLLSYEADQRASAAALAMEGAPTIKDAVMQVMRDHYWDSLTPQKELILKHIEGALRSGVSERRDDMPRSGK